MSIGLKTMADDIISILQASTKTALAAMADASIEFGLRTVNDIFGYKRPSGILVGVGDISIMEETIAVNFDTEVIIPIVIYSKNPRAETAQASNIALAEEILEELLTPTHLDLPHGGTILNIPRVIPTPVISNENVYLQQVLIEVKLERTVKYT